MKTSARKAKRRRGKDMREKLKLYAAIIVHLVREKLVLEQLLKSESDRADRAVEEVLEIQMHGTVDRANKEHT